MRRLTFDQGLSVAMTELTNQVVEATRKTRLTASLLFGVWMETLERPLRRRRRRGDKERRQGKQGEESRKQGEETRKQRRETRRQEQETWKQGEETREQGEETGEQGEEM